MIVAQANGASTFLAAKNSCLRFLFSPSAMHKLCFMQLRSFSRFLLIGLVVLSASCIQKIIIYSDTVASDTPDGPDYTIITCKLSETPEAIFGIFGSQPEVWSFGGEIPVWIPPQGGIVTGFNLLLTGTPDRALILTTRIWDLDDGTLLGEETVKKVKLNCLNNSEGQRHLKEFMAAFDKSYKLDELGDRNARLEVEVTFVDKDDQTYTVTGEYTGILTVVDWNIGY